MPEQQAAAWPRRPMAVLSAVGVLLGLGAFFATPLGRGFVPTEVLGSRLVAPAPAASAAAEKAEEKKVFTVSGSVADLVPGETRPLVLTLRHANGFPIRVTALSVAVANAAADCPASHLTVSPYADAVVLPANGAATTTLHVTLDAAAPDGCKARTWALSYSGTAVKR